MTRIHFLNLVEKEAWLFLQFITLFNRLAVFLTTLLVSSLHFLLVRNYLPVCLFELQPQRPHHHYHNNHIISETKCKKILFHSVFFKEEKKSFSFICHVRSQVRKST